MADHADAAGSTWRHSVVVLVTTETPDTVELSNLVALLQQAAGDGADGVATPKAAKVNATAPLCFDKSYTPELAEATEEYGAQVIAGMPQSGSVVVAAAPSLAAISPIIRHHAHVIALCVTVNAAESLPVAAAATAAAATGKGAKKPEPKKDPKKAKDKNAPAEVERAMRVAADLQAATAPEVGGLAAEKGRFIDYAVVNIATAAAAESTLASEVMAEIAAVADAYASYIEWASAKRSIKVRGVVAPRDVRTCATSVSRGSEKAMKWSPAVALADVISQAATNAAVTTQPLRYLQKIDQAVWQQMHERSAGDAVGNQPEIAAPTAAGGAFFVAQNRPDIPDESPRDDVAWLVQSHVKDVMGIALPDAAGLWATWRGPTPEAVEAAAVQLAHAAIDKRKHLVATEGTTHRRQHHIDAIDSFVAANPGVEDPAVEDELHRSIVRNLTVRERGFIALQTIADQLVREEFGHLGGFSLESHIYAELLSRDEFIAEVARQDLLTVDAAKIVTCPVVGDGTLPEAPSADPRAATPLDSGAPVGIIAVGLSVPPASQPRPTQGRRRQFTQLLALSGVPGYCDYCNWSEGGTESRFAPLLENDTYFEGCISSLDDASGAKRRAVAEAHVEEIYPYDGSLITLSLEAQSKRVTVSRDDVVCGLRSIGGRNYLTATFDDGVAIAVDFDRRDHAGLPIASLSVSGKDVSVRIDEHRGDVEFVYATPHRDRITIFCPQRQAAVAIPVFEKSRRVDNTTACVFRYFSNGAVQILGADGSVKTMTRDPAGRFYSLLTRADGTRTVRVVNDSTSQTAATTIDLPAVSQRPAVDLENDCRITSRSDGTMIVEYRHVSDMSVGRMDGNGTVGGLDRPIHTRVVAHADGTSIASFLSPMSRASTPMLAPLSAEEPFAADVGARRFVVESANAPKVMLFAPQPAPDASNTHALCIPFGDGTLLKRHYPLADAADAGSASMVTVIARPSESTVRISHQHRIVFVEPSSVQLSAKSLAATAINEGSWCFDYVHGAFRLVDPMRCLLEVSRCFTNSTDDYGGDFDVRWTASTEEALLIAMAPAGYTPHAIPKKRAANNAGANANGTETPVGEAEAAAAIDAFPPLQARLRDMVKTFVVENNLIGKRGAAGPSPSVAGATARNGPQTLRPAAHIDPSKPLELLRAPPRDAAQLRLALESSRRPLIGIERSDGTVLRLMCAADLLAYVHRKSSMREAVVTRAQFSGEPGIQQITFSVVGPGARQLLDATMQRAVLFATGAPVGTMQKFDGSVSVATSAPSWLPKSLLPVKRPKPADHTVERDVAPPHSQLERQILRFAPTTDAIRACILREAQRTFRRNRQVENYAKTLVTADPRSDEERAAEIALRVAHRARLQAFREALAVTGNDVGAVCEVSPSRERVVQSRDGQTTVLKLDDGDAQPDPQATAPTSAALQHLHSTRHAAPLVTISPVQLDFGRLPQRFKFSMTLTLRNTTTNAVYYTVTRARRRGSPISVLSGKGLLSPLATSTIIVVASVADGVVGAVGSVFEETLFIECEGSRQTLEVPVRGVVARHDDSYAVGSGIKVLGPVL